MCIGRQVISCLIKRTSILILVYFEVDKIHCNQPVPFTVPNLNKITANKISSFSADPDTGWKTVVQNEEIQGDLDDVAIQVKSPSGHGASERVEIQFPAPNGDVYLDWSTKPLAPFNIGGTCNPADYLNLIKDTDAEVKFQDITIFKHYVLKVNYCKSTYAV